MKGALLVCGTHSDAGKSVVTAGICRWLARAGVRVAPFKAQNMALNSVVTPSGHEIGRAQAMQAAACGVEPEAAMNPVLIKPSGERHSQVIVMGRSYADADARSYQDLKHELRPLVDEALADLRSRFDVVVCEGAGSPAEINLREGDLVNMGLAREHNLPVLLVADIDRGGVFGSLFGTLALLDPADQAHVAGFVINKFRGDESILAPGLAQLQELTGRPTLGVLPWLEGMWMDAEDSLALGAPAAYEPEPAPVRVRAAAGRPGGDTLDVAPSGAGGAMLDVAAAGRPGGDTLDVAVVRLRWMSNFTDIDALACEPGVRVRFTRSPADVERADLVVLPGTKATVEDLERLRRDGLAEAIVRRAGAGAPILGICGGYQMLGERIADEVESRRGAVQALGLLPVTTVFVAEKLLRRRAGACPWLGTEAGGYEIRHGRVERRGDQCSSTGEGDGPPPDGESDGPPPDGEYGERLLVGEDGEPDGCRSGSVLGTSWHGALEHDDFRRALLAWVAEQRGRRFAAGTVSFAARRETRLDALGDLVAEHLDTAELKRLICCGPPADMPTIATEVRACCPT